MNKERRKAIEDIKKNLEALNETNVITELVGNIQTVIDDIESVKCEEEDYKDNMPENMQQGERYSRAEEVVGYLEEAMSALQNLVDELEGFDMSAIEEAVTGLESAAE